MRACVRRTINTDLKKITGISFSPRRHRAVAEYIKRRTSKFARPISLYRYRFIFFVAYIMEFAIEHKHFLNIRKSILCVVSLSR